MKTSLWVVAILALSLLAACRPAAGPHSQACDSLRAAAQELNTTRASVMGSKPILTVRQVRSAALSARSQIDGAESLYTAAKDRDTIVQVRRALDQMDVALQDVSDLTAASQLKDRLAASAVAAADGATALYNGVCAAK